MDERSFKKLGEVLAFAEVGLDTLERGKSAWQRTVGEAFSQLEAKNREHRDAVMALAEKLGATSVVAAKAEATGTKLKTMRDLYVKDEWDNPAELLEWSGFFEGAAIAHWSLVQGVLDKHQEEATIAAFIPVAEAALVFHTAFLEEAQDLLYSIGQTFEAK